MNINDIKELFKNGKAQEAADELERNFEVLSNNTNAYTLAIDIFRDLKNNSKALIYSRKLFKNFPAYFDSYARYSQELFASGKYTKSLKIAKLGLTLFPSDKWILFAALRSSMKLENYKYAAKIGSKLIKETPQFIPAYIPLSECFEILRDYKSSLETLQKGLSRFDPSQNYIERIFNLCIATKNFNVYSQLLISYNQEYPNLKSLISKRLINLGNFYPPTKRKRGRKANHCDIICIASDEQFYIAEFIHHYIYLGFSRIYIGVNNITDNTLKVLKKISSRCKNVIVINVEIIQQNFRQAACYSYLYQYTL